MDVPSSWGSGVSPLQRHSPVRAPSEPDLDRCDPLDAADPPGPPPIRHEVKLDNWPRELHTPEIRTLFKKHDLNVVNVQLHRRSYVGGKPSSYAFVELSSDKDVRRAIDELHGGKVCNHQITVYRSQRDSRYTGRQPREKRPFEVQDFSSDVVYVDDNGMHSEVYEECSEMVEYADHDFNMNTLQPTPPKMPKLVVPAPSDSTTRTAMFTGSHLTSGAGAAARGRLGDSLCSLEMGTLGSGMPQGASATCELAASRAATPAGPTSATAVCERVREKLHAPADVVVANFAAGTSKLRLMAVFARFAPLRVRIMVSESGTDPDHFTYAYVTLPNRMVADEAALVLDGVPCDGRRLVVELKNV